jgi:hypothetical protein
VRDERQLVKLGVKASKGRFETDCADRCSTTFPEHCNSGGLQHHPSEYRVFAEYRGTWEQQRACTPDVWRLCGAQIPDVDRIVACLRRNTSQLSNRCRAVFEQGDNAPTRREDRDYEQKRYDRDYGPRRYDRDYGPRRYDREYGPRPYDYDDE